MSSQEDLDARNLASMVAKACDLEYLDSLQFGTTLRLLFDCYPQLSLDQKVACVERCTDSLRDSGHLNSPEFYEGLVDSIPSFLLMSMLRVTYLDDSVDECEFCRVVSKLSSSGALNLGTARMSLLTEYMGPKHLRRLLCMIADNSCEDIISVQVLLRRVYHPTEEYEVAEALREMTKEDWFIDIVPRNRTKAMKLFKDTIIPVFPSTEAVLRKWCDGGDDDASSGYQTDSGESLKDFIVSDSEDARSTVSDQKPRKKKKRVAVVLDDSD